MLNFAILREYAAKILQTIGILSKQEEDPPPLHYWAGRGNVPTIKHLLEKEHIDVNESYDSRTALSFAVSRGHAKAVETLMSFGAIDSNDIKMIGHCLGLRGNILLKGRKQNYAVSYESFCETYTLPAIAHHVYLFNQIVQQKIKSAYVNLVLSGVEKEAIQTVAESFEAYLGAEKDFYLTSAQRYKKGLPIIFRCQWPDHTGFAVLFKDKLYISDKGLNRCPGISCYQIDDQKLMRMSEVALATLIGNLSKRRYSKLSSQLSLPAFSELMPVFLSHKRLKRQKQMNCSYTNIKRGVEVLLMSLNEKSNIDVDKIYLAFADFDKFQRVDEYVEKYRYSPNKQAFEPLLKYLSDKTAFKNKRRIALTQHILTKLRSDPINMSDQEIAQAILSIPHSRSRLWDLYSWGVNLENGIFQKGKRLEHLSKMLTVVPSILSQRRIETLHAAQMSREGIAVLHHQFASIPKDPTIHTHQEAPPVRPQVSCRRIRSK